jgi:alkylation response protein AidB-like acyl-CoA dehydrogenase
MRQPGVSVRPIRQITGTAEFSETFFDGARTEAGCIVGAPGDGWKVANGTLAFERGVSTLGQNLLFRNELAELIALAKQNGRAQDPLIRQRLADAWIGLEIMRTNALRVLSEPGGAATTPAAMITKLYWATWHRSLGELAMDVLGPEAEIGDAFPYELTGLQRLFLFTRSDTIYAGSNQIQRNLIAERALGLPKEPRGR